MTSPYVPPLPDGVTIASLRALATSLATEAGAVVRAKRPEIVVVADTKSSDVDPVTAMDRAVEELLVARLTQERPEDAILGEEGDDVPGTSGLTWVVDPIDGTVNYLYGVASWSVSVAVVAGPPFTPVVAYPVGAAVMARVIVFLSGLRQKGAHLLLRLHGIRQGYETAALVAEQPLRRPGDAAICINYAHFNQN